MRDATPTELLPDEAIDSAPHPVIQLCEGAETKRVLLRGAGGDDGVPVVALTTWAGTALLTSRMSTATFWREGDLPLGDWRLDLL